MTAIEELTRRGGGVVLGLEGLKVFAPTGVDVSALLAAIRAERLSIITELFNIQRGDKNEPSIKALAWLLTHRLELDAVGWTRAALYRRNKYKMGIVWASQWNQASVISLDQATGAIVFSWKASVHEVIQRALPPSKKAQG